MTITVIPLKRLPKHVSVFDYAVPDALAPSIRIGQLITIPFQTSHIYGIVYSIQKNDEDIHKKKIIESIVHLTPLVGEAHLARMTLFAQIYSIGLSTITEMSLLPRQKRKLSTMNLKEQPEEKDVTTPITCHITASIHEEQQILTQLTQDGAWGEQLLLVVPDIHRIDSIRQHLAIEVQQHTTVWHSGLTTKQKFERWLRIRNGEVRVIIGTRGSMLLAYHHLSKIVIIDEEDVQHKQSDQAPRFSTKDIAELLKKETHYMTHTPSMSTYFSLYKKNIIGTIPEDFSYSKSLPTMIDMRSAAAAHDYHPLSLAVQDMLQAATEDVFLFFNRRGYATSFVCQSCGKVDRCTRCDLPYIYIQKLNIFVCRFCDIQKKPVMVCSSCNKPTMKLRGAGTQLLEQKTLELIEGNSNGSVIRIDSDAPDAEYLARSKQRIIVGTEKAFPYIRWEKTSHIICVNSDLSLAVPEFLANESLWHTLHHMQYLRKKDSTYAIQTNTPEHTFFQTLGDPKAWYTKELNTRHTLAYPPYSYLVRYMYAHENEKQAKQEAENLYNTLKDILTTTKKPLKLHHSVPMHPVWYRKKYWYVILVKITPHDWQTHLTWLNTHIPPAWKIDPNPTSVLSP